MKYNEERKRFTTIMTILNQYTYNIDRKCYLDVLSIINDIVIK